MESRKFQIGDRVGLMNGNGFMYGLKGTIIKIRDYSDKDPIYFVDWGGWEKLPYVQEHLYSLDNGIDKLEEIL